jgi:hypothetical protein
MKTTHSCFDERPCLLIMAWHDLVYSPRISFRDYPNRGNLNRLTHTLRLRSRHLSNTIKQGRQKYIQKRFDSLEVYSAGLAKHIPSNWVIATGQRSKRWLTYWMPWRSSERWTTWRVQIGKQRGGADIGAGGETSGRTAISGCSKMRNAELELWQEASITGVGIALFLEALMAPDSSAIKPAKDARIRRRDSAAWARVSLWRCRWR